MRTRLLKNDVAMFDKLTMKSKPLRSLHLTLSLSQDA
jgi:hypothetical protein